MKGGPDIAGGVGVWAAADETDNDDVIVDDVSSVREHHSQRDVHVRSEFKFEIIGNILSKRNSLRYWRKNNITNNNFKIKQLK